ncbi:MAG: hypothetical protein EOO30_12480 [Comamonadaceae bacterium]|nr:MAG: hypothetical protein EOO30_12480 [Comamonadaceae bacterium]
MVMFKAKFRPLVAAPQASGKPRAAQQQQQPQPVPPHPEQDPGEAPPIEKERGPQYPIKEPGPKSPPERVRELEQVA